MNFADILMKSQGPLGGPRTTLCQRLNYRTRGDCVIAALNVDNMLIPYSTELWRGCYLTSQTVLHMP